MRTSFSGAALGFYYFPALLRPPTLGAAHLARLPDRHRPRRCGDAPPGIRPPVDAVRRPRLACDLLHNRDGALADERDGHRVGADAVAPDVEGGVGGAEEGRLRRLGGCPLRHGFSENALTLEQRGLSLSDQDVGSVAELLTLFHEVLRRLPHGLRPESNFSG